MYDDDYVVDEDNYEKKCRYTLVKTVNPRQISPDEEINICATMTAIDEIPYVTITDEINTKDFKIVKGSNTATEVCLHAGKSLSVNYSVKPICDLKDSIDLDSKVVITYKKERNEKTATYTEFNDSIDVKKCTPPKDLNVFHSCCCEAKCKTVCLSPCDDSQCEKVIVDKIPCTGKILTIPIIVKDVCRNKSVAIAVFLKQKVYCGDDKFAYKDLGFKVIEVPAEKKHSKDNKDNKDNKDDKDYKDCESCKDLKVDGICFVLPVDLCDSQDIEIHVLANYLSFDYDTL